MSEPVGPAGPTTVGGGAGDALRALDLLPDLVLVMDQDWRVSYANHGDDGGEESSSPDEGESGGSDSSGEG